MGLYYTIAQSLPDHRKLELLKKFLGHHLESTVSLKLIFMERTEHFVSSGLVLWLVYSVAGDGVFFHFCASFGHLTRKNSDPLDKLYESFNKLGIHKHKAQKNNSLIPNFKRQRLIALKISFRYRKGKCSLSQSTSVILFITLSNLTDRSYDLSKNCSAMW